MPYRGKPNMENMYSISTVHCDELAEYMDFLLQSIFTHVTSTHVALTNLKQISLS